MTSAHDFPVLLAPPATPVEVGDPFIDSLIETARRNIEHPAAAMAIVSTHLVAAGGWCAPYDPDYVPPTPTPPQVPRLACGCPEAMLETGQHEHGCTILDIPATVEEAA